MLSVRALRPLARVSTRVPARAFSTTRPALDRSEPIVLKDQIYFAKALATGAGRNGTTRSIDTDAPLELNLSTPKAMGGKAIGNNPEELFAMGYASCFLGALQFVAARDGKKAEAENAKIHSKVTLGHPSSLDGFGLAIELAVEGVTDGALIAAAHEFCPYSRMIKYGVQVDVKKL